MSFVSFGNLARSLQMRTDNARLTSDLSRLTGELASGKKARVGNGPVREVGPLAAIERSLATLQGHRVAVGEAALAARTTQDILGRIGDDTGALSSSLLLVQETGQSHLVDQAAADARQRFGATVSRLNATVAGRSLFAGTAYDRPALKDGEAILADLFAAVGAETTADGALAAVDAWFAPRRRLRDRRLSRVGRSRRACQSWPRRPGGIERAGHGPGNRWRAAHDGGCRASRPWAL